MFNGSIKTTENPSESQKCRKNYYDLLLERKCMFCLFEGISQIEKVAKIGSSEETVIIY